jgi:hypothetical protein
MPIPEIPEDCDSALLRADAPLPFLLLWAHRSYETPNYDRPYFMTEVQLSLHLQGTMGFSESGFLIDSGELATMIEELQAFSAGKQSAFTWRSYGDRLEIALPTTGAIGSNIHCDIWLRDALSDPQDEHHCAFATTISWIDQFVMAMRILTLRYRSGQEFLQPIERLS